MTAHPDVPSSPHDKIWGLAAIARTLNVSVDTARRWAARPDVPIYRPADRYFASRAELNAWLRSRRRVTRKA